MPLITDIVTLRKYVKINFTATAVGSLPDMDAAERKFLIPILTQPVFDALQSQVTGNNVTWLTLLNICRAAVAPLAVWLDLPFIQAQIGDDGLKTTHSENREAAHQWEYNKIEIALVNKGMAALEDVFGHLMANAATYIWDNATAKDSFIRTAADFNQYVFLHQPQLTFLQLKPLMAEVEDHYIKAAIGDTFFEYLRDVAEPTPYEKIAIKLIKKAIANYTVARAVERLPVKITPNGLMSSLQSNLDVPEKEALPAQLETLRQSSMREADNYQVELMRYLNRNATAEIFPVFFTGEYYTAPAQPCFDQNFYRRGVIAF